MIGVLAVFGTLMAIGTVADGILNILKLEIIPERFLQVIPSLIIFSRYIPKTIFLAGFPRVLSLWQHIKVIQHRD